MALRLSTATRNAKANAAVDLLDAGAGPGLLRFYSGSQPASANDAATGTLLVEFELADPAFGNASSGVATANAISDTPAVATGTAGYWRALDSDANVVIQGTVTATGGGGDAEINTTSIVSGTDVSVTAWTYTQPAG